jgi:hypothetical protein
VDVSNKVQTRVTSVDLHRIGRLFQEAMGTTAPKRAVNTEESHHGGWRKMSEISLSISHHRAPLSDSLKYTTAFPRRTIWPCNAQTDDVPTVRLVSTD